MSYTNALNIRGVNGLSTLRVDMANILTISSSVQCQGNIVDAAFTGNITFPEHLRNGVLYIQDGMLKTSNVAEWEGGIVLPANVSGDSMNVQTTLGTEFLYVDENVFRVDGTMYVTDYTRIDGADVSIEAVGGVRAAQFLTASDKRLKYEIDPVQYSERKDIANAVRSLEVKRWIDAGTGKERMGFVADDVESVFPQAVQRVRGIVPTCRGEARYEFSTNSYTLENHGLEDDDEVCYSIAGQKKCRESLSRIEVIDKDRFTFKDECHDAETLILKGKVVNDLKTIDYDTLLAGLLIALQNSV